MRNLIVAFVISLAVLVDVEAAKKTTTIIAEKSASATVTIEPGESGSMIHYGIRREGGALVFFVSAELIGAAKGKEAPKIMVSPEFGRKKMNLDNDKRFYTYTDIEGEERSDCEQIFCFYVGRGKYIPHVLKNNIRFIKKEDVVYNGVGGYNFRIEPIEPEE